jgi:hypothetical protein
MIAYNDLPNSVSEKSTFLTLNNGQNSIVQQKPMWLAGAFSRTRKENPLYSNATATGQTLIIGFKG